MHKRPDVRGASWTGCTPGLAQGNLDASGDAPTCEVSEGSDRRRPRTLPEEPGAIARLPDLRKYAALADHGPHREKHEADRDDQTEPERDDGKGPLVQFPAGESARR